MAHIWWERAAQIKTAFISNNFEECAIFENLEKSCIFRRVHGRLAFPPSLDQQVFQLFVSIVCSPTWYLTWEGVQSCHEPREKTYGASWYTELLPCPAKPSPCLLYFNVCFLYLFFAYFCGLTTKKSKYILSLLKESF